MIIVLTTACSQPNQTQGPPPGEWNTFSANWAATGERYTLHQGSEHSSSIFRLSGTLLAVGESKLGVGFRAEAIGFSENQTRMVGTSVWTDDAGDQVFSTLAGEAVGTSNRITGSFVGGSGRYAGATGEYEFQWQYVIGSESGEISGRALNLNGRIRVGTSTAP